MHAQLPRVAERANLFGLARGVFCLSVLHVTLASGHLAVDRRPSPCRADSRRAPADGASPGCRWGRPPLRARSRPARPSLSRQAAVEGGIARIEHRLRRLLVLGDEVAQLFGRNIDARVLLVTDGSDFG